MAEQKKLSEVIPPYVYTGVGNRGRESIGLISCMIPGCENSDEAKLHVLEIKEETTQPDKDNYFKFHQKIKVRCDVCGKSYILKLITTKKKTQDEQGNTQEEDVAINADAYNETETEYYGNIGML
jgi:hypothetical protein